MDGGSERIGASVTSRAQKSANCNRIKFQLSPRKGSCGRQLIEKNDLTIDDSLHANPNHSLAALSDASRENAMLRDFVRILVAIAKRKLQTTVAGEGP